MTFLLLIYEFLKTGAFAIGGGLATIPFLEYISKHRNWFTFQELMDFIAISESTPGPIGINMATYAGFKAASSQYGGIGWGILGAIIAPLSLVVPSVLAVLLVSKFFYEKFKTNKYVAASFAGVRASTAGLICGAMGSFFVGMLWNSEVWTKTHNVLMAINKVEVIAFTLFTVLIFKFKKIHPVVFIAAGAVIGLVFLGGE